MYAGAFMISSYLDVAIKSTLEYVLFITLGHFRRIDIVVIVIAIP